MDLKCKNNTPNIWVVNGQDYSAHVLLLWFSLSSVMLLCSMYKVCLATKCRVTLSPQNESVPESRFVAGLDSPVREVAFWSTCCCQYEGKSLFIISG